MTHKQAQGELLIQLLIQKALTHSLTAKYNAEKFFANESLFTHKKIPPDVSREENIY